MVSKKIIVSGRVQGVFYRRFVYNYAIKLGLKGYVKNLVNGDVEIVVQGETSKINELIKECRKGPNGAYVENIELSEFEEKVFASFEIRY
ncbi:Acylphosphatase [uncultured archaeon]|nr:Acylphosphatase [uncultured archaeon]